MFEEKNSLINQFSIRKLNRGERFVPDKVYFSANYPPPNLEISKVSILYDFIEYLKSKRKISKFFLKIKYK